MHEYHSVTIGGTAHYNKIYLNQTYRAGLLAKIIRGFVTITTTSGNHNFLA